MTIIKQNRNFWLSLGAACTLGASLLAGCGGNTSTQDADNANGNAPSDAASSDGAPSGGIRLNGAGATFPYPIYSKWFEAYGKSTGTQINYQPIGSGGGIQQLKSQTVDFGASDAPLKDDDLKEMPAKVVHIPTVAGAVVAVYNLEGVKDLKLSGEALADIFLGKITRWNDPKIAALNAGATLPSTRIAPARRSDGSGTTAIFTGYLATVSPEWKTKVGAGKSVDWPVGQGGKGNDGVAAVVKSSPGSIGYVELAYAKQNDLSYAAIRNKSGQFVKPSVEATTQAAQGALAQIEKDVRTPIVNAAGAGAYPISGFTYILVYQQSKDAAKGEALKKFLSWAMTDGQKMASELDYAPLPASLVELNKKTIASLK